MTFVTVFKSLNSAEANLVATQLEAAGFNPTVVNELSSLDLGSPISASGIRVQVPEDQSADARELLDATINSKSGESTEAV